MKKKGFTLIELLAVIVILAVIALIATPLIMNTINDARDSAMQRSVQNIRNSAETHLLAKKTLNNKYVFTMNDFNYKGEKYDKMNITFNTKNESSVAVYKGDKCFYILAGSNDVVIDDTLDEEGCLAKAKPSLVRSEYGFYYGKYVSPKIEMDEEITASASMNFIFYEDGSAEMIMPVEMPAGSYVYRENEILIVENGEERHFAIPVNNGMSLHEGEGEVVEENLLNLTKTPTSELNEYGFYFNEEYLGEINEAEMSMKASYLFKEDGSAIMNAYIQCPYTYEDGSLNISIFGGSISFVISEDGKALMPYGNSDNALYLEE